MDGSKRDRPAWSGVGAGSAVTASPRLLEPAVFSTHDLPAERQFEGWRAQCASVVEMIAPLATGRGFAASHRVWSLGGMALSRVATPGVTWRRTAQQIRRDSIDHWVISVARRGEQVLRTGSGGGSAPAGSPYLFSLHEPIEGRREDMDWIALFVSRDLFPELGARVDAALHAPLEGALGRLLGEHVLQLAEQLPRMSEADLPHAAEATRAMIRACVTGAAGPLYAAAEHIEHTRLARLKAIIRRNLASPTLGPRRLCQMGEVSRSQLYRIFAPLGGVARYIQGERLRQAGRAIANPAERRDIGRIAESLGFYDPSSFSRAFRREFGITPRDLRVAAQAGLPGATLPRGATAASPPRFTDILRAL
ncbi:helix-turn-helix domain-containing protein [Roseomonas fluvialis]|uniref:AraC family transcriptional regulator n=1 Tax=Roseomonas fluvialis TaxID=1750527 RepID=A0ABM7XZ05_9PROT|nr:AraC family transcriptional regulator [Roseomonas fluvialis]BDG70734.1 AraC family transcriptional regulator [Roseomonas fluvialis]